MIRYLDQPNLPSIVFQLEWWSQFGSKSAIVLAGK